MNGPKWSNCHIWAWRRYEKHRGWLLIRETDYKRELGFTQRWYWTPFRALGAVLQAVGQIVTFIGWVLRWGHWYHVYWSPDGKMFYEYVPRNRRKRLIPPLIFRGEVRQKASDDNTGP